MMHSNSPFFSIVVPTRNRASMLVDSALKSILRQTFNDFEIVVCDNASTDNTREAVQAIQDPRIRYIHSPEWIPKEDFFQFSLKHAKGKFCTLFFDDDAMITRALEKAYNILKNVDSDFLCYSRACVYHFPNWHAEHQKNVLTIPEFTRKLVSIDAHKHLEVIFERMDIMLETPMVTNAFYRTAFLNKLVEKYGRLFPHGHMGDYNVACFTLWNTDKFLYLDFPLAVFGHWKENTSAQLHDLKTTMPEYREWIEWITKNYLSQMPIKSYTWTNCVAAALLDMKRKLQLPFDIDRLGYLIELGREICRLKQMKINMSAYENEYFQYLSNLSAQERMIITDGISHGRRYRVTNQLQEVVMSSITDAIPPSLVGRHTKLCQGNLWGFNDVLGATEVFEELVFNFAETFKRQNSIEMMVAPASNLRRANPLSENEISEKFASGDYTTVATAGQKDKWQTYAAFGLIGKTQEAIAGLAQFDNEEARFYSAVASWIGGDEAKAVEGLKRISTPHAKNLLNLILKPKIKVLAQFPWRRACAQDLLTGMAQDTKFDVQNISFHPQDLPIEPYADIHKFYDPRYPPDFYLCQMVEWHLIPPNIQELPCPIFAQTADYDLHIQAIYPWLQLFDEMIVCDGDEWNDVRRLVSVPVSTFPKSFCVPNKMPPVFTGQREIDFFMSGTVKNPYNPDKARLLNQVIRIPDINVKIVNGYLSVDDYLQHLAHSKVTCTYTRRPRNTPTRGLEALSMGCALVVQKDNVLTLFAGEEEGVLTYTLGGTGILPVASNRLEDCSTSEDLPQAIYHIVRNWLDFEIRALRGASIIRREFSPAKAASQYLRFATFLAAKPHQARNKVQIDQLDQRRMVKWKGWLPKGELGRKFLNLQQANISHWRTQSKELNPRSVNLICREIFLDIDARQIHTTVAPRQRKLISKMLRLYQECAAMFPRALVLHFNWIRNALHFGLPEEVSQALSAAREITRTHAIDWQLDVLDDVFTWDYCNSFFNYRRYTDIVTEHLMTGKPVRDDLINLILASLHYYLGHYTNKVEDFQMAVRLDPDFPFYKFLYAQTLIRRGETDDITTAIDLLIDLAENSILNTEAYKQLLDMKEQCPYDKSKAIQIRALIAHIEESIVIAEPVVSSAPLQLAQFSEDNSQTEVSSNDKREQYEETYPQRLTTGRLILSA